MAGAGIVGVCCALWLQRRGFRVTLVDGNEPGSGTSSGNACTIARYGCIPINSPDIPGRIPGLLSGGENRFSISPWYALAHLPWLFAFLKYCSRRRVGHIVESLASLLASAHEGLDPLVELTGTGDLLARDGILMVYESQASFDRERENNRLREKHGSRFTELNAQDIRELEPALRRRFEKGLLLDDVCRILDPAALAQRFFRHFLDAGGGYVSEHAQGIVHTERDMKIFMHSGKFLRADRIVISCGAFSRQIEGCDSEKLPLETERGYNIQYPGLQHLLSRPVSWTECGFYAVPMHQGLRFAGTVEIAGLAAPKNPRHIAFLTRKSREMLDIQDPPGSDWLGFRPTLPDSLPVISASRRSPNTYYAFGHQHLGLTLAGITGKLVAQLAAGEELSCNLRPFSADRFR